MITSRYTNIAGELVTLHDVRVDGTLYLVTHTADPLDRSIERWAISRGEGRRSTIRPGSTLGGKIIGRARAEVEVSA